LLTRCTLGLVT